MLPITTQEVSSQQWKAETLSVLSGVRGLCILWVFWQHSSVNTEDSIMGYKQYSDRMNFNTAIFLIMTGFTSWCQHRNEKMNYRNFILGNYFSLIPLNVLSILIKWPPEMYAAATTANANASAISQFLLVLSHVSGFGVVGSFAGMAGNHLGPSESKMLGLMAGSYFGSMLFLLLGIYALFHWVLRSSKILCSLFQQSCIPSLLLAIVMGTLSIFLGQLTDSTHVSLFAGGQLNLLPMLMLGVCIAEVRHHLPPMGQAVLGHSLTIDILCAAFLTVTFMPYSYSDTSSASTFPTPTSKAEGFSDLSSVLLLSSQMAIFCLLVLAFSCQIFHKKRSIVTHFVLRRSLFQGFFAKYSYTLYLSQLPVIFLYYPQWMTMLLPEDHPRNSIDGSKFNWAGSGCLHRLLMLLMSLALAMVFLVEAGHVRDERLLIGTTVHCGRAFIATVDE